MSIQRIAVFFIMAFAAFLVSCCPATSLNPLSPPESARYDKRLEGTWVPVSEKDEKGYLHIGRAENNLTRVVAITLKKTGELEYTAFTVFPTFDQKGTFLNIKAEELMEELPPEDAGYVFARYELNDDGILSVYYMDDDLLLDAIKEKKLKGEVRTEGNDKGENNGGPFMEREVECVRITDSSGNLIRFIRENVKEAFFPDGIKLRKLDRAAPPAQ